MKALAPFLGLFLLFTVGNAHLTAQKVSHTNAGGWMVGGGAGGAYQKSDLVNSWGYGLDFVLGSQLFHKENAFLSLDWKFRFLGGKNRAFDHRITPENTYSNVQYSFFTCDLELGLTLNRLRERTGIILTGFGGGGITYGRTFTDLYDGRGFLYDFGGIDPDRDSKLVYGDLVTLSDGDFETSLTRKAAFLPTAGIYLGYQLTRSLALGVEYKANFYLTEENGPFSIDLDNTVLAGSGTDRNNYVSLRVSWNFRKASSTRDAQLRSSSGASDDHAFVSSFPLPSVTITEPPTEISRTESPGQTIRATIDHIDGADQIRFFQNGFPVNRFTYNENTKTFVAGVRLREGENSFRIEAIHRGSSAEDLVMITLENPPAVARDTSPAVLAGVTHPESSPGAGTSYSPGATDVAVTMNEPVHSLPVYEAPVYQPPVYQTPVHQAPVYNAPVYSGPVYRPPVNNEPEYQPPVRKGPGSGEPAERPASTEDPPVGNRPCRPPVIRIIDPSGGAASTSLQTYTLRANVRNAANLRELRISVNGVTVPYHSDNDQISSSVPLNRGRNSLFIHAVNECGESSASVQITCVPPAAENPGTISDPVGDEGPGTGSVAVEAGISGIRFNPGNSDWQFCLVTPSGAFNRENLTHSNFSYSGAASSLYFLPIAGSGNAMVNGLPYSLNPGQYYLFTGNLRVTVSTSNPGSMGHWSVMIEASRTPVSGNGNNRPKSPCEPDNQEGAKDHGRGNPGNNGSSDSAGKGNAPGNGNGNVNGSRSDTQPDSRSRR